MGKEVKRIREKAGLSAVKLEEKTRDLGYPITRGTIAKIEGGHRDGKFDIAEIIVLAVALEVSPLSIIFPPSPSKIEFIPGKTLHTRNALYAFTHSEARNASAARYDLLDDFEAKMERFTEAWGRRSDSLADIESRMEMDAVMLSVGLAAEKIAENWDRLCELGLAEGDDPEIDTYKMPLDMIRERRAKHTERDG